MQRRAGAQPGITSTDPTKKIKTGQILFQDVSSKYDQVISSMFDLGFDVEFAEIGDFLEATTRANTTEAPSRTHGRNIHFYPTCWGSLRHGFLQHIDPGGAIFTKLEF